MTGDFVSYAVQNLPDPVTLLNTYSYLPTPVLGVNVSGASPISLGVQKDKAGAIGDLAADFSQRSSYISPLRSKYDSAGHGVLDPVIDHESGLCALARVLKNNSSFLKKSDLAALLSSPMKMMTALRALRVLTLPRIIKIQISSMLTAKRRQQSSATRRKIRQHRRDIPKVIVHEAGGLQRTRRRQI